MMKITSKREFTCEGRKWRVCNVPKVDQKKPEEKYYVTIRDENGYYASAYNTINWEQAPYFKTIKEAQFYVRSNAYVLGIMDWT